MDKFQKGKRLLLAFHDVSVDQGATSSWYGVRALLNIANLTLSVVDPYIISMCIKEGLYLMAYGSKSAKVVLTFCEATLKYIVKIKFKVVSDLARVIFWC